MSTPPELPSPEMKAIRSIRVISMLLAVLTSLGSVGAAAYYEIQTPFLRETFVGMGFEQLPQTQLALMRPLGLFCIILLVLSAILMLKEFMVTNKVVTLFINVVGSWVALGTIFLWEHAIFFWPVVAMMNQVNGPPPTP